MHPEMLVTVGMSTVRLCTCMQLHIPASEPHYEKHDHTHKGVGGCVH